MTLFVTKGDAPLTDAQLEKRAQANINLNWSPQAREESIRKADGLFTAFMDGFSSNHATNVTNNTFNSQLAAYRTATSRLAQYVLSVGRAEVVESQPTGEQVYDEDTMEMVDVMVDVIIVTAVAPVEATVIRLVYSDDIDAEPVEETIENPAITADVSERAAAQSVVDATPQEVKDATD